MEDDDDYPGENEGDNGTRTRTSHLKPMQKAF